MLGAPIADSTQLRAKNSSFVRPQRDGRPAAHRLATRDCQGQPHRDEIDLKPRRRKALTACGELQRKRWKNPGE